MTTNWARNQANDLKDHFGQPYRVGQTVAKPSTYGHSAVLEIRKVVELRDGKVYLDGERPYRPLRYSGRCVILNSVTVEAFDNYAA